MGRQGTGQRAEARPHPPPTGSAWPSAPAAHSCHGRTTGETDLLKRSRTSASETWSKKRAPTKEQSAFGVTNSPFRKRGRP